MDCSVKYDAFERLLLHFYGEYRDYATLVSGKRKPMKTRSMLFMLTAAFAAISLLTGTAAAQAPAPAAKKTTAAKKADATPPPTAAEIADAKSKGMVWVNLGTGVYHKDGEFFGKTKRGKFMTEADATKAGYRAAKTPAAAKKDAPKAKAETKK